MWNFLLDKYLENWKLNPREKMTNFLKLYIYGIKSEKTIEEFSKNV